MKQSPSLEKSDLLSDTISGTATPATDPWSGSQTLRLDLSLADFVIKEVEKYREKYYYKIAGGAITKQTAELCPELPSLLWHKLDIVCFIFKPFDNKAGYVASEGAECKVDEESDSMVRKAIESVSCL